MDKKLLMQSFEDYVSSYDLTDAKINLKYIHTKKVAEKSQRIAKALNLSKEDQDLSWEIGMLHDIGRFEQLLRYNTFNDSETIDHANFGADLLFGENLFKRFDPSCDNYELIEKAIRYHSSYELPTNLTEREKLFCQIIRDADKADIFRANYETGMEDIYNTTKEELANAPITPQVYQAFLEEHTVLRSLKKTVIDHLISHLCLYFGMIYDETKKITVEEGFLWKLANFHSNNPETEATLNKIRESKKEEWQG